MASQEHLALLGAADDISTTSDDDDDEETTSSSSDGQLVVGFVAAAATTTATTTPTPRLAADDDDDDDSEESSEDLIEKKKKRVKLAPKLHMTLPTNKSSAALLSSSAATAEDDKKNVTTKKLKKPKKKTTTETTTTTKTVKKKKKMITATKDNNKQPTRPVLKLTKKNVKKKSTDDVAIKPRNKKKLPLKKNKTTTGTTTNNNKKPATTKKVSTKKKVSVKVDASTPREEQEIKVTVVDSDEPGEDDAVAAVVEEPSSATKASPTTKTARKSTSLVRPIRLPPMSSPGLLLPPSSGVFRGAADAKGFTTPASVFDHCMSLAGYTVEGRTKRPHRGSSIKRNVGDMFDSNVHFALNFPKVVPDGLLGKSSDKQDDHQENGRHPGIDLMDKLLQGLTSKKREASAMLIDATSRKRRRQWEFRDMVPLSLTMPYPEQYIKKRLEYVKQVEEREKAIIASQEAEEKAEIAQEEYAAIMASKSKKGGENGEVETPPQPHPVPVPPIPEPPSPPRLEDLEGFDKDRYEANHPLYPPKGKSEFVAHLDKGCFHLTEGRYFGLLTNEVADPHFVGPCAPGIAGINASGGTGLATAHAGSSGSGSSSILSAPYHQSTSASAAGGSGSASTKGNRTPSKVTSKKAAVANSEEAEDNPVTKQISKKKAGPSATATAADLRKAVEAGGEMARKLKDCIIRAAVHASRSGRHGQAFLAPNGEAYPDVSKAFAAHAGVKPCVRCKNNKQGAYHCRLRRRHKDLDFDGSNSPAVLVPLFDEPLEDLLCA